MKKIFYTTPIKNNFIYLTLILFALSACKGAGGKFEGLDAAADPDKVTNPVQVSISSFTPSLDPVNLASNVVQTFGITLAETDSSINYTFILDNNIPLQSGKNPFYNLNTNTLTPGSHILVVTAKNSISTDSHTFNINVNSPTVITTFTPTLTGTTLACGVNNTNISVVYSDADIADNVTIKWYLNNTQVIASNTNANVTNDPANKVALINFHPDCSLNGINFIRLDLDDGREVTTKSWTISVIAPVVIQISDSIPLTNPTVLTASTSATFGVTLQTADPTAKYNFILDNTIPVQNDSRSYTTIAGSTLTPGNHTLKVIASNANSTDTKTFNIRKNTPPGVTAFFPALSGASFSCGSAPITLYADMFDSNSDTLTYAWTVDDASSAFLAPANSGNHASAILNPSCTISGNRVVKVVVSDGYESVSVTWAISIVTPVAIKISSFSPAASPTILTNTKTTTFAVSLSPSDVGVIYNFSLKNLQTAATTVLQNGALPFFDMVGSTLVAGTYELTVTASNGTSSDAKVFVIRKNSPPLAPPNPLTFSPTLIGSNINCTAPTQIFQSYISDPDSETMASTWFLDGVSGTSNLVNSSTQGLAKATYTPSCSDIGVKTIRLEVSDGNEITSKTWTVTVYNPSIVISISSFTPSADPVYLNSNANTTLGVTLATSDPSANYSFLLDNAVVLQTGASPFLNLASSSIAAGSHTLKVTASNVTSSDTKTFNLIINAPPSVVSFTPTLTGTTLGCGLNNVNLSMLYADANLTDVISVKWYLNNSLVSFGNPTATTANDNANKIASLNFSPNCTQTGINLIRVELNDGREITSQTWTVFVTAPIIINISDFTPTADPIVLTSTTTSTFGVTLLTADATAKFNFVLDNSISLQNDGRTFYSLTGASLLAGTHTLKVTASNSNSSDVKNFNIRKNAPPVTSAFSPALTGNSLLCGSAPITLYADMTDVNSDTLSYTWFVDDAPSGYITPGNSGNRAQANFNPNCAIVGNKTVKVVVSDGYESTTISWGISVFSPITIQIASYSPTVSPVIATSNSNTTFALSLVTNDPSATFLFTLKNMSSMVTTTLQSGLSPFYDLAGSTLAPGNYQLTAKASNATSNAQQVYTVRKNSPPEVPQSGGSFSPALTGLTMSCGASSQIFQSTINDADSDTMTTTWTLDGSTVSSSMVTASTPSLAKVTFTPTCSDVGVRTIRASVTDGFETTTKTWTVTVYNPAIVISINSFTPSTQPTELTSNEDQTFGVGLLYPDPSATYTFLLDNTTTLQTGTNPFFDLSTSTLTAGAHIIKVTASNVTSSDTKTFTLNVNAPPVLVSFTPILTGTNLACNIGNVTMSALYADANLTDTVSVKWYFNNTLISFGNATATASNDTANKIASLNYRPDCTQTGINSIRLDLNDGREITSQTWTVFVSAPITIQISDMTPTTDPTILTGTTSATFGVTLLNPDSTANYNFVLDNSTTVQNDKKTYYNLSGATLSTGMHTLKVTASNASSSDVKIFNIRKNSAPTVTAFSPALSGTSPNCGTAPITLYADMFDANGDTLNYTWLVDDAPSAFITTANVGNRAQVSFNPSCAISGTRVVKAIVSDGYETVSVTWSITVKTPIAIVITSFLPASNPTVLTNAQTTTFAVALGTSDSNVTYSFLLKNLSTAVTTTLQSGGVPFYNLVGSSIANGLYELTVSATNGSSSDSRVFTVRKNSPPAAPPSGFSFSPAATGTTLNCGSSSQIFQSDLADADNDIMSITWYLNGSSSASNLVSTSTQAKARATYSPTCLEVGVQTVKVDIYDGYETTSRTWTVTVVNPTIVAINAYSPSTDPVYVLSTGSQIFNVSATGKAPLAYEWKLDGSILAASTDNYTTLTAASLSTGAHTLVVKVNDSDSNQSRTFNVIKNAPPVLASIAPASTTPKVNINTVINFSGSFTDANGDAMTVSWLLNGSTVLAGNPNASVSTVGSSSTLTFTPTAARIGDNTIVLQVSDGKETKSQTWTLNVNYFSDICNNMGAGRACTIVGRPGRSSNVNPTINPSATMIKPQFMAGYVTAGGATTSSYFFNDDFSHSVWFYNKTASPISILGQVIGAGVLKAVMGVGQSGVGISGTAWNDFPLTNPRGIAWDHLNQRLFIAEENGSRILMLDSSGTVTVVLTNQNTNNATFNANGTLALSGTYCATPRGLAYNSTTKLLYVACATSATIKAIDTTNATPSLWTASIVSGYNASTAGVIVAGSSDGTNSYGGTNMFVNPLGLKLDATNNILYVTDSGHCKVKAINLTGSARTSYFYGAITLPANGTVTIAGINAANASACTNFTTGGVITGGAITSAPPANAYASARFNGGWLQVELNMSGSTLRGIFVSEYNQHRIGYLNNTASSVTIGNSIIPSYSMNVIWNGNGNVPGAGTGAYAMPCPSAAGNACYINNPSGMYIFGSSLHIADYNNFRVRTLDFSVNNGVVADDIGFDRKPGFAGNGGTSSENVQFNTPLNLYFDANSSRLLISDFYNYRIRSLNLNTGRMDSFISNGNGNANTSQADPTALGMQGPRGVVNYQNHIIFGDNQGNNCLYRAWNTLTSTQTILGVSVFSNAVQTIAGNYINGCGAWNPAATTGTDSVSRLQQPQGVTTDGTNLYFANTGQHCIIKLDVNGNMSPLVGLCGTSGLANGAGIAYSNSSVRLNYPTAVVVDPRSPYTTAGNFFILDQTITTATKIRYVNQYSSAVTIFGVTINPGEIKTIFTAADIHGADLASFDNQICFSSGGDFNYASNGNSNNANHNVICFNRDDSSGTSFTRFGRNPGVYIARGYTQENQEEEGIAATSISLASPAGLAFDSNGNLYIAERDGHDVRMVKKWW